VIDGLFFVEVRMYAKEVFSAIVMVVFMRKMKYQVKERLVGDDPRNDLWLRFCARNRLYLYESFS
jgi:hypothetical protein